MLANRSTSNFKGAEDWDLEFWQKQTPQQRLSALAAIRNDVLNVIKEREAEEKR